MTEFYVFYLFKHERYIQTFLSSGCKYRYSNTDTDIQIFNKFFNVLHFKTFKTIPMVKVIQTKMCVLSKDGYY